VTPFDAKKIKAKARVAAQAALYRAGEKVATESLKAVPRKTGKLAGSSYVKVSEGAKPSVEVGYSAEYAAIVHSKVDFLSGIFEATKNECASMVKSSVEEAIR